MKAPMAEAPMKTAPRMGTGSEIHADSKESQHGSRIEIAGSSRKDAGLTNPDGAILDLLSVMTMAPIKKIARAPQMAAPQIEDSPMITGSRSDAKITDSTTTRNGKGMGSGSGRPLPSTHLEKRVSDRQSRDGAQVNGHRDE